MRQRGRPSARIVLSDDERETLECGIANAVVTPVATNGTAQVYTHGSTNVLLDVTGWFTGAS